ncbi:hypothetical protein VCUG_01266 [Vavraia culicis subsp. floridensis]|uniref:Uncharacterized protein n=1 Tax=Vavraia culicis (isolate floridensis) TaxID=948595 RepID=L2GVY6_VAVCU|nr:uncharacterized protein VCUG_01266 [Vavraia culicis subsp. floridensis]ELA47270.1 hypothetical protein VCUG_01266 [Vavraia culicis subsp. floridensis]
MIGRDMDDMKDVHHVLNRRVVYLLVMQWMAIILRVFLCLAYFNTRGTPLAHSLSHLFKLHLWHISIHEVHRSLIPSFIFLNFIFGIFQYTRYTARSFPLSSF